MKVPNDKERILEFRNEFYRKGRQDRRGGQMD